MEALEEKGFRYFMFGSLSVYVILGFWGTVWIADEFDAERTMIVSYLGVPVVMLFYGLCLVTSGWWRRHPRAMVAMVLWMLATFGWGNVMLLNAIGSDQWEIVDIESHQHALDIAHKRGGFGWLYQERW
jgi:hypothetical protein